MSVFSDKVKPILAAIAPELGIALGGPFGGLAGSLLAKALGTNSPDDPANEAKILAGDPQTLAAIQKANNDFKVQMESLGITREKLVFDDIANARARETAVKDHTPAQLAWMLIGGFIVISLAQLAALMGWAEQAAKIPPQGWLLIGNISGYLANEAKQAAAYYFGSTMASKDKDTTIADIAKSS
jgi:hypothetical protein